MKKSELKQIIRESILMEAKGDGPYTKAAEIYFDAQSKMQTNVTKDLKKAFKNYRVKMKDSGVEGTVTDVNYSFRPKSHSKGAAYADPLPIILIIKWDDGNKNDKYMFIDDDNLEGAE